MTANGVTAPIALVAVSSGMKSHQRKGEDSTRMGITLGFVLRGHQPTAPMVFPFHSIEGSTGHAMNIPVTNAETLSAADPT